MITATQAPRYERRAQGRCALQQPCQALTTGCSTLKTGNRRSQLLKLAERSSMMSPSTQTEWELGCLSRLRAAT